MPDTDCDKQQITSTSLRFHLRNQVTYVKTDGGLRLILKYPLKIIKISPFWQEVIQILMSEEFIPIEIIQRSLPKTSLLELEQFLSSLVIKGYAERQGFVSLEKYTKVSIIIPVHNRPTAIRTCIESLLQLDYPREAFEIIVVDDASTDETLSVAQQFPVKTISMKENRQAPFCRNYAAKTAEGEILAFIDSDCTADPLWLKELIPQFRFHQIAAVGGFVDAFYEEKGLDRYEQSRSSLNMGRYFKESNPNDNFFYVPSCNLLVRKELFAQIDGFSEDLIVGEDVDFCWRLQDQGHQLQYLPMGKIFHQHRNHILPFIGRRFDYGTSEPTLQTRHKSRSKIMVIPFGAAFIGATAILSAFFASTLILILGLIPLMIETTRKLRQTKKVDSGISAWRVVIAIFRGYIAFYYHFCAFLSRYYLIWSLIIVLFAPFLGAVLGFAHLLTSVVDYRLKKPRLNFFQFFVYFTFEQLGYQLGVWWSSLKNRKFSSVFPRIKFI